jgi:hypothetical protein
MFNDRRADLFPATLSSSPLLRRGNSDFFRGICNTLWPIKWKCGFEQEFVVGGYTRGRGGRSEFGALSVGYYEQGRFRYASKVGTGFSNRQIREFVAGTEPLRQAGCPFVHLPEGEGSSWSYGARRPSGSSLSWSAACASPNGRMTDASATLRSRGCAWTRTLGRWCENRARASGSQTVLRIGRLFSQSGPGKAFEQSATREQNDAFVPLNLGQRPIGSLLAERDLYRSRPV